ncbi:MAG: component of SufBCD complex [Cypionkella sp.]|uniref:component of SufBCD complex n=1 Tax=Cypionkella sp. TaxID=2811411 RepID=UPI002ABB3E02|nr:component of SufBCD complex [Cypionkella sp.]MDZ4312455.1 component of SufBCD complex [Cypionkella sp.]MDZ4394034.1 component of SufBCD complex [Cypionkella sp.]
MNLYQVLFELIDMRSFSNLWYWIMLAVMWSSASHWVLGIPFDVISRARRQGGPQQDDLETLVRINTGRLLDIVQTAGVWVVAVLCFMLSALLVLAVYYKIEFAQAVLFLLVPMSILSLLSLRTARLIVAGENEGQALHRRLVRHRITTQALGMMSIFVTSMFGMYVNLYVGVLG